MYQLLKDGEVIFEAATETECYAKLHKVQGQSWHYALKYGGYKIKKKGEETA